MGKKFAFGMGLTFLLFSPLLFLINYYTLFYQDFYSYALVSLNGIFVSLGLAFLIAPGAELLIEEEGDNDKMTIQWWVDSSKGHKVFWIFMLLLGMGTGNFTAEKLLFP
ncbi:MAG: hypothetical protein PQJ60_09865 [Spirochaetales bacterium]|nr:hypothetical protein [Spirochaetales bacterium]